MAKKKEPKKKEGDAALPKFGGFHPLAGGLEGFKAQLVAEDKQKDDERKAAIARGQTPPKPPPAPRPREPERAPASSHDDDLSFHRMMSGVVPLDVGARGRIPKNADIKPGAQKLRTDEVKARAVVEAEKALDHLHSLVDDGVRFEVSDDGRRVEGRRIDVLPDLVRSLRRGMLPIDATLDLHGKSAEAAQAALVEFLRTMRSRGERCVLVIHGKGERHPGGGVLRGEISAWLSQGKSRDHVAAYATARDDDGGEGAIYVALRR
ncbi:MAG: Smr domain protein [Labilithrix sp.]|nr:Smr domain protein [Labilithrix sp.]